jgi:hypothetical protein
MLPLEIESEVILQTKIRILLTRKRMIDVNAKQSGIKSKFDHITTLISEL